MMLDDNKVKELFDKVVVKYPDSNLYVIDYHSFRYAVQITALDAYQKGMIDGMDKLSESVDFTLKNMFV